MDRELRDRRLDLERHWRAGATESAGAAVRPEVLSSWERSARTVAPELDAAPVAAAEDIRTRWAESRLGRASRIILEDLEDLASSGDLMAALTDESVTIAWIAGGRTMARRADRVHFSLGGCWAESAVGTNALGLAERTARPATVFSAEHYAPMVHDWVCYSAPILDPDTGLFLGVLDLSTTWERSNPALLTTVTALTRCVEYELAASPRPAPPRAPGRRSPDGLTVRSLGAPQVLVDGAAVALTRRQLELLVVLSLHADGMSLDELTGRVYGDQPVRATTVKAELSHLRQILGGRIGSRPYRLVGPVESDHHRLLDALAAGDTAAAVAAYGGPLLAFSESPDIQAWRHHIDAAVRDGALRSHDPEVLWELSGRCPDDLELHEACIAALGPDDARRSIAVGRIAAAREA
ncbi:hypothetical protein K6U06_07035 [Acidiferrimicrobium sp. IK]|uniref:hypothetical protein n=1 Tax=Acidiferrimicrobium sp. IK TaxID=2871700 RepID=UPI0021CAEDB9|nr:hypothetical protein [Acidiferrimicrobium sp. IK]MCU4184108.1 hypothetical protein [Acidiferrimicrobium sp. IK]